MLNKLQYVAWCAKQKVKEACVSVKSQIINNDGDENMSKVIWIVIAFAVGAILLTLLIAMFGTNIKTWVTTTFTDWFPAGGESRP